MWPSFIKTKARDGHTKTRAVATTNAQTSNSVSLPRNYLFFSLFFVLDGVLLEGPESRLHSFSGTLCHSTVSVTTPFMPLLTILSLCQQHSPTFCYHLQRPSHSCTRTPMDSPLIGQLAPFADVNVDDLVEGLDGFVFASRDFDDCEVFDDMGARDDGSLTPSTCPSDTQEIAPRLAASRHHPTTMDAWSTLAQQAFHPSLLFPYAFRKSALDAELHSTHWGVRVLGNGLATRHLSLISTSSRTPLGFANVCSIEQAAGDQSLVAARDIDGITLLKNMRLDDLNLESGNTSTALDQDPHAHSGMRARQDKYARLASGVAKMPALLSSDGAGKESQAATRLVGALPASDVHVRKGLKSLRNTSCIVPWEVKRLTVDRNLVLDAWHVGGVLGCGTYGTVFHVFNKLSGTELAMKVLDIRNPLPGVVCDGLLTELLVLERLAHCELRLPYLLQPTLKRSWAWQTTDGYLHMLTVCSYVAAWALC